MISKSFKKQAWSDFIDVVLWISHRGPVMRFLVKNAEKRLWKSIVEDEPDSIRPAQELKFYFVRNLLRTTENHLRKGIMDTSVFRKMVKVFVRNVFVEDITQREILKEENEEVVSPSFLVLSPTHRCNLRCPGCYAGSEEDKKTSIPYWVAKRVLREKVMLWHSRFTVISGGEPFLWRSDGRDLMDLVSENDDNFFMVYTNGTLIDERLAERMAELGNITPAISVEGFEESTDKRRGKGTFKKVLYAFRRLRDVGVPFGISVQATRDNWDEVTSKEFLKFYFDEQGVFYGWLFQYMPIGRSYTLKDMITPEERLEMFKRNVSAIKEGYNYIDFWNQGVMTDGCLAAGRNGGYMYIDWAGNVMPCVFIPYWRDNIIEIYKRGGTLNDVLYSDYFKKIRKWQDEYAYRKPPKEKDNLILPCPIRDHHDVIYSILQESPRINPCDVFARECLHDRDYHLSMIDYDKRLRQVIDPVWDSEYKRAA